MKLDRIVIVGPSNLGPYHLARYNAIADTGVRLTVLCCPVSEFERPWAFLPDQARFDIRRPPKDVLKCPGSIMSWARRCISEWCPDAVVTIGYNSWYNWAFALAARLANRPSILWLVGWKQERPRQVHVEAGKGLLCRGLYDACFATGVRAATYAKILGIPENRIWRLGNVVDNEHFRRKQWKGQIPPTFLYVGRLASEKNLFRLLAAFESYRNAGGTWNLKMVGTGPLRVDLQRRVDGVAGVELIAWADYESLPRLFWGAGCVILPSTVEPWGLVVNEAMAAGLPVLVSRRCGCYPELCREGVNGLGFEPESVDAIRRALQQLSQLSDVQRREMGRMSESIIASFALEAWATAFVRAAALEANAKTGGR